MSDGLDLSTTDMSKDAQQEASVANGRPRHHGRTAALESAPLPKPPGSALNAALAGLLSGRRPSPSSAKGPTAAHHQKDAPSAAASSGGQLPGATGGQLLPPARIQSGKAQKKAR